MATFNTTDPKPGYVYDSSVDTWFPLSGIAPASSVDRYYFLAASGATSISGSDENANTLAYTAGLENVFLNGVLLARDDDYTATNGTSITGFSPALSTNDVVEIITFNASNIEKTNAILTTTINAKGDLIAGTSDNTAGILTAGTNGYILSTNSSTATGLEWIENQVGDITAVSSGTGITVTSGTGPIPSIAIDTATTADLSTAQTLTNKTLTSPTVNTPTISGGTLVESVVRGLEEDVNVVASSATGTINFDLATASIWYYTSNAGANHTLNFRHSSSTSLNSVLATGDAITAVWLNTNGSTAYYPNVIQIDGTTVTPKVPAAISAGNASAVDAYSFTIIKTASTPTYTVLETQTKFA